LGNGRRCDRRRCDRRRRDRTAQADRGLKGAAAAQQRWPQGNRARLIVLFLLGRIFD
jgi:hypothetical protein